MSVRRSKSDHHLRGAAWWAWLAGHGRALSAAGLPPEVTLSESHWTDFLENGELDLHPAAATGFCFAHLSPRQMADFLAVLEASPTYARAPITGWLRHQLGRGD